MNTDTLTHEATNAVYRGLFGWTDDEIESRRFGDSFLDDNFLRDNLSRPQLQALSRVEKRLDNIISHLIGIPVVLLIEICYQVALAEREKAGAE